MIANSSRHGDIRFGFHMLLRAASLAEKAQRQTITASDIASAIEEENRIRKIKKLETARNELIKLLRKYERERD